MNEAATKSVQDILQELHAWSQVARSLYDGADQPHDSAGLRALKLYLSERHTEHLRELRHCLHHMGGADPTASRFGAAALPDMGAEIHRSLVSSNRLAVVQACGALEKHVALAYEQASTDSGLVDEHAQAIVNRHVGDLDSSRIFVQQIQEETRRASPSPASLPSVRPSRARRPMATWWSR